MGKQSEFQDSQGYTEKPCLEKKKKKKTLDPLSLVPEVILRPHRPFPALGGNPKKAGDE